MAKPATNKQHTLTSKPRKLHHHVRRHYYAYMPNKRHHRILIWVVFFVVAAIIAAQLLYPLDRGLPFARLAGENVFWKGHDELAAKVDQKFRASKLRLTIDQGKSIETTVAEAGAEPLSERMIFELSEYPFWLRFIPTSVLWWQPEVEYSKQDFNRSVLEKYASEQAKALSYAPTSARLAIEDGKLTAVDEKLGSGVDSETVASSVSASPILLGEVTTITVPSQTLSPKRTAADFASVRSKAEAALARDLTIIAKDRSFSPSEATMASWLVISEDSAGRPTLSFDAKAYGKYLDTIDAKAAIEPTRTNINLVDGREVSRSTGKPGDKLDRTPLVDAAQAWLMRGEGVGTVTASFVEVAPPVIYNSKYTSSQAGLQAYLNDLSRRMDVHVAVQQLDSGKWSASTRATDSIPSASTFKLYISMWLFDQMDQGKIKWSDPILDTNVSTCFDRMTVASTNPCAYQWLDQIGRTNMNNYLYKLGFSRGTSFTRTDATHSTARDLLKMMIGIETSSLMQGSNRDKLIHNLTNHPFRYGIPTGSAGRVYDKVGFLWDYIHDAAVVHHPKGTYAVVIMTKGQSYATIANITREIEKIMYG